MKKISFNHNKCVHCGACTAVCNTNSLYLDNKLSEIIYNPLLCNGCTSCIKACPLRLLKVHE